MRGILRFERDPERLPESPELGGNGIGIGTVAGLQSCDQPFDGAELIAAPAEGAHHLFEDRRVVACRAPRAIDRSPSCAARAAANGSPSSERSSRRYRKKASLLSITQRRMAACRSDGQPLHDEAGAEQDGELRYLVGQMTGEEPGQIDQRHRAKIDGLSLPKRFKRVLRMTFAPRDGPDAQSADAR